MNKENIFYSPVISSMTTITEFAIHLQLQNGFKYIGQLNSLWLSTTKFYIKDFHIFKEGANLLSYHTTLLRRHFPGIQKTSTKKNIESFHAEKRFVVTCKRTINFFQGSLTDKQAALRKLKL